jgi:diguanylate cyclase (GGDEF)-like protein/PAS domain S-box-containing protein
MAYAEREDAVTEQESYAPRPPRPPGLTDHDYRQLLDRVPAIVYIADPGEHGVWHFVGEQIEALLGYTAQEWCARPELWAERLHPEDRERALEREAQHQEVGEGSDTEHYRLLHRDGSIVWLRDDAHLLPDSDGHLRWHGVMTVISDYKRLEAELECRAAQQAAVAKLGEHALEGASPGELLEEAVTVAATLLEVELAAMAELIPDEEVFHVRAYRSDDAAVSRERIPATAETQAGYTVLSRAPVIVEDWLTETRFHSPPATFGLRSGACVLIEGSHGAYGVLSVQSRRPRGYGPEEVDFLQSLANVLADALERQAIDDDIRHRALHDRLTDLPNRVLFMDRLEQGLARLRRRRSLAAVLFLDFDHFKVINDSLGHHVGDELLTAVAPRLRHALRASDTVAHLGGDEFAILLEDIEGEEDAVEMAQRVAALFAQPFVIAGGEHFVSASVGIALARGGESAMELVRDADAAMYRAKERGRARYEVFDAATRGRVLARLRVENDLRRALDREEFSLHYQPLVSLADRGVVGVEALIRWHHPERGLVSPAEFVPVAEQNGLIEPIGRWVLERACGQAAMWHAARPDARPLEIAVNLSAVQLASPGLVDTVTDVLAASGLPADLLCLEITETAMLRDPEVTGEVLRALGALGVRMALDDFGTGYSSLSYLPHLPLDTLKIDRSFVDGLGSEAHDTAIVEAIIAMARALSLGVVAEGVETERQAQELARLGCERAQGYYFARPMPASEIPARLAAPVSAGRRAGRSSR